MDRKNIIIVVALLAVVAAVFIFSGKKDDNKNNEIKDNVEVTASNEERNAIQKNIDDLKKQIDDGLKNNLSKEKLFDLYVQLGNEQRSIGAVADARDSYRKAIELVPNSVSAWSTIFSAYFDMKDYDNARLAINKSLELHPADWNMWRNYIDLERYQFQATPDQLQKIYQDALKATGNNINIITVYAQFLEQVKNDKQGALDYWKKALQIEPKNKVFADEVARLKKELGQK